MAYLEILTLGSILLATALWVFTTARPGTTALLILAMAGGAVLWGTGSLRWQLVPLLGLAALMLPVSMAAKRRKGAAPPSTRKRRLLALAARTGLVVLVALCLLPVVTFPRFVPPAPTGPHPVGTLEMLLTDHERPEAYTSDPDDYRQIPVQVWYPANPVEGAAAPYWTRADLLSEGLAGQLGLPAIAFSHLGRVETNALSAAPAAAGPPFPVLVFSHGYGGVPAQNTVLMEELASHGFAVFSLGHPFESLPVELDSGVADMRMELPEDLEAATTEAIAVIEELVARENDRENHEELLRRSMSLMDLGPSLERWVADASFVLDEVERISLTHSVLSGRIDVGRTGVFGHSFGGAMATQLCAVDARCMAAANLDGGQLGSVVRTGVSVPLLLMYSEWSRWINDVVYRRSSGPAYQVAVMGSGHLDYTDLPFITPLLGWVSNLSPIPQVGPIDKERMSDITAAYVLAFFNQYLKGEASNLLDGPPPFEEVRFESRPAAQGGDR